MKTFEEKFTAWVDGELKGRELAEFEAELPQALDSRLEKTAARQVGELLRKHGNAPALDNPDFFNLEIMRRIEAEVTADTYAPVRKKFAWTLPRLALAGAFSLVVSFGLYHELIPRPSSQASSGDVTVKQNGNQTTVHYTPQGNSDVALITGSLPPGPDKKQQPKKEKEK